MPPRIVVVGSLMMDLVVRAPRIPAPGESLISHSFHTSPGGKGANQAIAAARLGAEVHVVGRIGKDRFGEILRSGLQSDGVDVSYVSVDPEVGTGVAVPIVLDGGENAIFSVPQSNLRLRAADIEAAASLIRSAAMLMVQFEVGMEATLAAARIARAANVPVMLNPAPVAEHPPELLKLATLIVANEVEAAALVPGASGDHSGELAELRRHGATAIVTLGAEGAVFDDGSGPNRIAPFPVAPVDSVGAGDAFCGGLAVALVEGTTLRGALRFASASGALATTRPGAQASLPTRAQVEALLATGGGTFRALSASDIDDGRRRTDTGLAPGLAH